MKLLLAAMAPAVLLAQHATLAGVVQDSTRSPVPGASLSAWQVETGTERTAKSNGAGEYAMAALAPGHYKITVDAKGFQVKALENVELHAGQNARLDFALAGATLEIHGTVKDARTGEMLGHVLVRLADTAYRTNTDASGQFAIRGIPSGDYVLTISAVGYHMEKQAFHMTPEDPAEFDVVLTEDTLRQTRTVEARSDPFETLKSDSPDALVLAGNDAKNLDSVFVDDPLRSVQGLPGVSSDKDYDARFSLRGADFSRIGLYMDGILLHEPFHEAKSDVVVGTVSVFNSDMVEEMELHEGAFPMRFDDRTAGALSVETRDGSRDAYVFRGSVSDTAAGFMAEGPLGDKGKAKGSWLVAGRKSYIQYILKTLGSNGDPVFDMEDLQARLRYDLTPRNSVTLSVLESYSKLDQSQNHTLSANTVLFGYYYYTMADLGWRYTPSTKVTLTSQLAYMREKFHDVNSQNLQLDGGYYGEWVWNTSAAWMWNENAPLEAGASLRRIRNQDSTNLLPLNTFGVGTVNAMLPDYANGTALRSSGYVQQSYSTWSGSLRVHAGASWDNESIDHVSRVTPQASVAIGLTKSTRLDIGVGEYTQYPEIAILRSIYGNPNLLPMSARHLVAGVERRLGSRTRLRGEFYQRDDRDMPFQPYVDPRIAYGPKGMPYIPVADPAYYSVLNGTSRGGEVFLQRSSANRLTGWVSYSYGRDMQHDTLTGERFPSDYDQRHTVSAYGGVRVSPTVNLSLHTSYGSGFPMPAYFARASYGVLILGPSRDQVRLPAYQRTDLRINKSWIHAKWKFTLYGEIINLTNHGNYFFESFNSYDRLTGQISATIPKTFPILPTVGIAVEW